VKNLKEIATYQETWQTTK